MYFDRSDRRSGLVVLAIPLILSAFIHLWNITGIPYGLSYDENIYIRRAMHVMAGQGPQESRLYDHPYFAQLFLAGALTLTGYPNSLNPSLNDVQSFEMLYVVPRLIMGLLAVLDTFLIYKITEYQYNSRRAAIIASVLFAIVPLTIDTRRVLLEPIQLPFFLSSILFAIFLKFNKYSNGKNYKQILFVLISGAFLGLAIFTKIPAFTMIPLAAFLIYANTYRNLKAIGLWFVPVILIPLIWPIYAMHIGQFDLWFQGIFSQTHRAENLIFEAIQYKTNYHVLLISLGSIATIYSIIKRDLFIFLGIIPYLTFPYFIGYVSFWHFILLLPVASILSARIIESLLRISFDNTRMRIFQKPLRGIIIAAIIILGITTIIMMLLTDDNSFYFKAAAYVSQLLYADNNNYNNNGNNTNNNNTGAYGDSNIKNKLFLISNPFYSWIPKYVFHLNDYQIIDYYDDLPIISEKVVFVADPPWNDRLTKNHVNENMESNFKVYSKNITATFGEKDNQISVYHYASPEDQQFKSEIATDLQNRSVTTTADTYEISKYSNITSPNQ